VLPKYKYVAHIIIMKKAVVIAIFLVATVQPLWSNDEGRAVANFTGESGLSEIINITAIQAWEMLQNESDGVQIPVDVRTFGEYFNERIATPHSYDFPRLYPLQLMEIPFFAALFNKIFYGKEVILYCRTSHRSYIAAKIIAPNFNGKLYNLIGGITAWKEAGLPTKHGFGFG